MDDNSENACDMCKISYASETELREHIWSLMHHIKIEQKKKGSFHNCTLCYAICENIIAYGKHLNEERHKKAVEESHRRGKESDDELQTENVFQESSQERYQEDSDKEKEIADYEENNQGILGDYSYDQSGQCTYQHRTYSGTNYDDHYKGYKNGFWCRDNSYYKQHSGQNYNNIPHWNYEDVPRQATGYGSDYSDKQWDNYDRSRQKNRPCNLRTQYNSRLDSSWDFNQGSWNANGRSKHCQNYSRTDPNFFSNDWPQNIGEFEWYQNYSGHISPAYNHTLIACARDADDDVSKLRDKNQNESLRTDEKMDTTKCYSKQIRNRKQKQANITKGRIKCELSQNVNSASRKRCRNQNWKDSFNKSLRSDKIDSGLHSLTRSCKKGKHKGLVVKLPMPVGKHRSSGRGKSKESDSTTGISVVDSTMLSASTTSALSDSNKHLRNRIAEFNFSRPLIGKGSKKKKTTQKTAKVSPKLLKKKAKKNANKFSLEKDATILQKAEKLSQDLREKRKAASTTSALSDSNYDHLRNQIAKFNFSRPLIGKGSKKKKITQKAAKVSPKLLKKKAKKNANKFSLEEGTTILKKAEKITQDLREKRKAAKFKKKKAKKQKLKKMKRMQILSEINKSYATGKLTAAENHFVASLSKKQSTDASQVSCLNMESPDSSKSSRNTIEQIHQEIEKCSREETNSSKSSLQASETGSERRILKDQLRSKSLNGEILRSKSLDKETLLKLINSPRSHKERLKLSEFLSKYSKSQKKLSMPRFNLKMTGLYDDENISLEEINYEDLSADLQLQIAELLHQETPSELGELNSSIMMQVEVKSELPDITEYTCTSASKAKEQSDKVDVLRKEFTYENATDTKAVCLSDKEQEVKETTDPITSIFEHIYNISKQEEQVRQQIALMDTEIEDMNKFIENAMIHLGHCGEKRKTLLAEEERLRSKRLNILEAAHSSNFGISSDFNVVRASSLATSASSVVLDKSGNDTNQKNYSKGENTTLNFQSAKLSPNELLDTKCDLKIESIVSLCEDESKLSYDDHDNINKATTPNYLVIENESPAHTQPSKNCITLQTEPERDLNEECVSPDEVSRQEFTGSIDVGSDSPKTCSDSQFRSKKKDNLETVDFVTLSSPINDHGSSVHKVNATPAAESDQGMEKAVNSRIDEFTNCTDSDDLNSSGDQNCARRKYLMEFMGSIPRIDSASFFKQLASLPSSNGVTYMLMDKKISGDTLEKLQTVVKDGARDGIYSEESIASSPNEPVSMDIDVKPDLDALIDNVYNCDNAANNCSAGEEIRNFCISQVQEQCSEPNVESAEVLQTPESGCMSVPQGSIVNGNIQTLKTCSHPEKVIQDSNKDIVGSNSAREIVNKPPNSTPSLPSPNKKKLKSKKEKDKKSICKQKEEFNLPSASDGNRDSDIPLQAMKLDPTSFINSKEEQHKVQRVKEIRDFLEESENPKINAPKSRLTKKNTDPPTELMKITEHSTELPSMEEENTPILEGVQFDTGGQTESESDAKTTIPSDCLKLSADVVDSLCCAVENIINPGKPVQFQGPSAPVIDLQVFCDKLYVCYQSNQIHKYNLVTGKCLTEYSCHDLSVNCLLITSLESPQVTMFAGGASMRLLVFNTEKSEMVKSEEMDDKIQCLHQNWGKLYIGLGNGVIVAWNLKQEKRINEFQCCDRPVSCITSATEGTRRLLLAGSQDFFIYICDANTGLLFRLLKGHSKTPYCIQVDGHTVYSASGDKTVIVSDLLTGEEQYKYKDHRGIVTGLILYKNMVVTSSYDKLIRCFDKKDHSILKMYYGAGRGVITRMALWNDKIVSSNREGLTEAVSLKVNQNCSCQYKNCKLVFGYDTHLLHHIMTDHNLVNCRTYCCQWKDCNEWITSDQDQQNIIEHLRSHIANSTS